MNLILIGCLALLGWYWWQDNIHPLTPEEQEKKAAEDKRTLESNKRWLDTLQSATFTAMLIDPHLKYEFGAFHPLDLTLSSLNAATASLIANKLCNTYHLNGGLRVYLADGHLAAQCDFLPDTEGTIAPATATRDAPPAGGNAEYDAALTKFLGCVQTLRSAAWSEFAQFPSGEPAYTAWAKRFEAASHEASDICQRQESGAATAICKLMAQDRPMCQAWLNVLTQSLMNGRTSCDTTHCVTSPP